MKYVVVIADGAADRPIAELGGKSPFEAARTPRMDELARMGRVGRAVTTPPGFEAGSDVCSMDLLGYDPARYHTGRAPLEAAALGLKLRPSDWIFRMNFVTVGEEGTPDAGLMLDHSAGAISDAEARELVEGLAGHWRRTLGAAAAEWELTPGVSYRNILVDHSGKRRYDGLKTPPPHEIPRRPWREHQPAGEEGRVVRALMESAREYLPSHPVNTARVKAGNRPANAVWIWGQGTRPNVPSFAEKFGLGGGGGMITAVDLLAGIAALIGWERVECPGISSYHDTDYAEQGRATCRAIDRLDIVCCHVESPDEASHQGDWKTKLAAVEAIDGMVVGPVLDHLQSRHAKEGWRMMVLPDHYTLVSTRKHDATPVPWVMAGAGVSRGKAARFTEAEAAQAAAVDPGDGLMELFLRASSEQLEKWS